MNPNIIVIAIPLEEELLKPLYGWGKEFDFHKFQHIHFIHAIKKNIIPLEFGLMESPDERTFKEMAPTFHKFLKDEGRKIIPEDFKGKITFKLTTDFHPEENVINYLNQIKADLIVVSTGGKHGFQGFFHHSFTEFMVKFSPCDVYVVRPLTKEI